MLLRDKTAIVYGAAGKVGSSVARVFAREGAHVFLAGRKPAELTELAGDITAAGGRAEVAEVDATDRDQVEQTIDRIVAATGGLDVSVNAVSLHGTVMGTPLIEMKPSDYLAPVEYGLTAHFLTATAAARHMVQRGSGAILTFSTTAARLSGRDQKFHLTGGFGTACGAIESFTRSLAGEVGPHGVRVVCLRPEALPETWSAEHTDTDGAEPPEFVTFMTEATVLNRLPRLVEVAETAAFVASDRAGAMTRTVVNLSCGSVLD